MNRSYKRIPLNQFDPKSATREYGYGRARLAAQIGRQKNLGKEPDYSKAAIKRAAESFEAECEIRRTNFKNRFRPGYKRVLINETTLKKFRNKIVLAIIFFFLSSTSQALSDSPRLSNASEITFGLASFYSTEACRFNSTADCKTASGVSLYDLERGNYFFAASYEFPIGSRVKVCNKENEKCVIAKIMDRGPSKKLSRSIDLSLAAFKKISPISKGVTRVTIERMKGDRSWTKRKSSPVKRAAK